MISVVMSVYGKVDLFRITIKSILNQVCSTPFEIIVIDDGNDFESSQLILKICQEDDRIRYVKNEKNIGLTKSLVKGCNLAKGNYIARIDNGDLMIPNSRLEKQVNVLESNPEVILVGGAMEIVSFTIGKRYVTSDVNKPLGILEIDNIWDTVFPHVTVMFSKKVYDKAGGYNEELKTGQDTDLWPRMLKYGKPYRINEVLAIAPMMKGSISVDRNNIQYLTTTKNNIRKLFQEEFSFNGVRKIVLGVIKLMIPRKIRLRLMYSKSHIFKANLNQGSRSEFVVLSELYQNHYE